MWSDRPPLERMNANRPGNWTVSDVDALCREYGVQCLPQSGGSHYKVAHASQRDILTIPRHPPLKPIYVRKLVRFIDAVIGEQDGQA